jgi:hypothetical protein
MIFTLRQSANFDKSREDRSFSVAFLTEIPQLKISAFIPFDITAAIKSKKIATEVGSPPPNEI